MGGRPDCNMKFLAWAPVTKPMGFGPRVPNCCIVRALSSGVIIQGSMVQILSKDLSFFSFIKSQNHWKISQRNFSVCSWSWQVNFQSSRLIQRVKSNCQIIYIEKKKIALDWFLGLKLDILFHLELLSYK